MAASEENLKLFKLCKVKGVVIFLLFETRMLCQKRNKSYLWLLNLIKCLLIIVYELLLINFHFSLQKQSSGGILQKNCS